MCIRDSAKGSHVFCDECCERRGDDIRNRQRRDGAQVRFLDGENLETRTHDRHLGVAFLQRGQLAVDQEQIRIAMLGLRHCLHAAVGVAGLIVGNQTLIDVAAGRRLDRLVDGDIDGRLAH